MGFYAPLPRQPGVFLRGSNTRRCNRHASQHAIPWWMCLWAWAARKAHVGTQAAPTSEATSPACTPLLSVTLSGGRGAGGGAVQEAVGSLAPVVPQRRDAVRVVRAAAAGDSARDDATTRPGASGHLSDVSRAQLTPIFYSDAEILIFECTHGTWHAALRPGISEYCSKRELCCERKKGE